MFLLPEPKMDLYVERAIDVRAVAWPAHRLTSNDNTTKRLYDKDSVKLWRSLGARAFKDIPPIPGGRPARVVVYFRQPPGRHKVRDIGNCQPMSKAIIDGITHGIEGRGKGGRGPWPDDSTKYVIGQDVRELLPSTHLEVVVQVYVAREGVVA